LDEQQSTKRTELADKELELKKVEDELDNFQEKTKSHIEKMYYDLENRAKKEVEDLKMQL
jgi:hypothetical protein